MNVKDKVVSLIKEYGYNPFDVAKAKNIHIYYGDLGGRYGNYMKYKREKYIMIDSLRCPTHMTNFVCAHELGHAECTPNENTAWLKTYTLGVEDKIELIAYKFAVEFILPDEYLRENSEFGIYELAKIQGVPQEFVKLKQKY